MPHSVLITDPVDAVCIDMLERNGIHADVQLKRSPEELRELARGASGWVIRSGTRITSDLIEAGEKLVIIGRAGVGVDNVDLEAATRRGILVINAPDGNTISTAEHTCAMLLSLARRLPQAHSSLQAGQWDRKPFTGLEVYEKTLGVVGVGKIGRAVAERMKAFGMRLLAFDPMLSQETAERIGVELVSLDALFAESDFLTFHTPLNEATRGLLGRENFARCKPGVRIVNCARGGIVDEEALLEALESGRCGGAALDVYSQEPPPPYLERLLHHPNVVATPHIAASTEEAQEKVAVQITEQVIMALQGKPVLTPVNGAAIRMASQREVQPFLKLADKLGRVVGQLGEGAVKRLTVRCSGDVPHRYADVLSVAAVKGLMSLWRSGPVNLINASMLAQEMGLKVEEQRGSDAGAYTSLVEVVLERDSGVHRVAGTLFGGEDVRLIQVDDYTLEVKPTGRLLLYQNIDRPGMLASVGAALAEAGVNIGALALGRKDKGSLALTVVSVDEAIPEAVIGRIAAIPGVESVRFVTV